MVTSERLYRELHGELMNDWQPLNDRPEETPDATLASLWFLAAGEPRAAERSIETPLPPLSEPASQRLRQLVRQRLAGTPLAYLTGRQVFMGIEMLAGPEALIPRKETEILGYGALQTLSEIVDERGSATVIDLCTGCGNLALALASHQPECRVYGADLSPDAVALAQRNAEHLGLESTVRFRVGDLFASFEDPSFLGSVDLVVCNPPYISTQQIVHMPEEIQAHEPHMAFDGGPFGVSILMRLISETPRFLRPGGWLCFEVGLGQGELIRRRLQQHQDYVAIETLHDSEDRPRALLAQRR